MPVYLVRAGEHGPVKIGFSTNVRRRVSKMQTDNPGKMVVLRIFEGGKAEERQLHQLFADHHIDGEWHSFSEAMLGDVGLVEMYRRGVLPPPKQLPRPPPTGDEATRTELTREESLWFAQEFRHIAAIWHAHREFRERRSIPEAAA
jgi:hypothetical protein